MTSTVWDNKFLTPLLVTVVAILVWVYAEGKAVSDVSRQVTVRFVAPKGQSLMVAGVNGEDKPQRLNAFDLEISVVGARGALSQMDNWLNESVSLEVTASETGPIQTLNLAQALAQKLQPFGVNLQNVTPEQVRLWVEPIDTLNEVPVTIASKNGTLSELMSTLESPPTANPETVTVRVPRSERAMVEASGVVARLDPKDVENLARGSRSQNVLVALPDTISPALIPWTSVQPATVDVSFTVRETTSTWTSPDPVPIWTLGPQSVFDAYDVRMADGMATTVSLTITGPAAAIEELNNFEPRVFIELTNAKAANALANVADGSPAELTEPLRFLLPRGIRQENVQTDLQGPVRLTLVRRAPSDLTTQP